MQKTGMNAHVAQPVERILGKDEVIGSNPIVGSILLKNKKRFFRILNHSHCTTIHQYAIVIGRQLIHIECTVVEDVQTIVEL